MALAFAPLQEICPDRATPELTELTARLGSMIPYRQAASVMAEFLPLSRRRPMRRSANAPFELVRGLTARRQRKRETRHS
jgi:hypothetical protein